MTTSHNIIAPSPTWPTHQSTNILASSKRAFDEPCKYIISKKKLGAGSFSTVYECRNKYTGSHYAAKMYDKRTVYGLETLLQNEFLVLKKMSMSHQNILTMVDYFETADKLFLITDIALGGDLFDRIVASDKGLPESDAREIARTLVATVEFLHKNDVVHRDLKAENILIQSDTDKKNDILVADFGFARILSPGEKLYERAGTLSYMAPEMLDLQGYSMSADVWSIGVIVYFMLCAYMPFDCETDEETKTAIRVADYQFEPKEYWENVSDDARSFLKMCFQLENRPSCSELLAHPFLAFDGKEASEIPRASSSMSLTSQLRESVAMLQLLQSNNIPESSSISMAMSLSLSHSSSRDVTSRMSLLERSRNNSLIAGTTSRGACCSTPEQVSRFSTPVFLQQGSSTNIRMSPSYKLVESNQHKTASVASSTI
ncbi:Ca2+/calmodulin-dependent protein kinase [Scheffersomyces xylosifermentans]|uniref:Ca2+/calmodulin-dependent protein kinase n=1 Tax=Scheffersomyces xylosifermentans TaxID=1304137 RepID=UPI00315DA3FA